MPSLSRGRRRIFCFIIGSASRQLNVVAAAMIDGSGSGRHTDTSLRRHPHGTAGIHTDHSVYRRMRVPHSVPSDAAEAESIGRQRPDEVIGAADVTDHPTTPEVAI
jgi:hypothetical protein